MPNRREFLEAAVGLPLSLFLLPHSIGFGNEEPIEDTIDRGGPFSVGLIPCDVPNKNGRIYPSHVVKEAIVKFNEKKDILFGGLDYPINHDGRVQFRQVAFKVTHLRITNHNDIHSGKWLWGDVQILDTPQGRIMKELLHDGGLDNYAFRTAGIGNVYDNNDGHLIVKKGYKLIAIGMIPLKSASHVKSKSCC